MINVLRNGLCIACALWTFKATAQQTAEQTTTPNDGCTYFDQRTILAERPTSGSTRDTRDPFAGHEGKTIRNIVLKTIDVFDEENPEENNRLYRFVNSLHINTLPNVIKSQLLFKEGDSLRVDSVHETERILRTRSYLTNAYIQPAAICDNEIDVLVVTQDAWSLEPEVSFKRKAGESESGFGISDDNIFGTGNSAKIEYEQLADRNSIGYSFSNPHFLNKPYSIKVSYADTSDGRNTLLDFSRPFYSLNTPWSAGVLAEDITEVNPIRSGGKIINEFRHQIVKQEVYAGLATRIHPEFTDRWYVGITKEEDSFYATEKTEQGIPEYRKAVYPWIGYEYIRNEFGVYRNVNQINRTEDIPLGINADFRLGYGGTALDGADEMIRYMGEISNARDVRGRHVLEMGAHVDGRYGLKSDFKDSTIIGGKIAYNYFLDEKNRWYASLNVAAGQNLEQYEQLTGGDTTGLRGYPTDYQRGNKRYVISVERRYFSDIHLFNLIRMGGVIFVDGGRVWGDNDGVSNPFLANVGFGLRLSSSKVRVGNVIHINVATPLVEREGISDVQLLVHAQQSF
jgi:hypothetical protein